MPRLRPAPRLQSNTGLRRVSGKNSSPRLAEFKARSCPSLPLAFWTFHDRLEEQHVAHTEDELDEILTIQGFNEERFLTAAREILNAVYVFWDGLSSGSLQTREPALA